MGLSRCREDSGQHRPAPVLTLKRAPSQWGSLQGRGSRHPRSPGPRGWCAPTRTRLSESAARRAYSNDKFRRTGDLNLDINIRGRQETASNFFRSQGVPEDSIASYLLAAKCRPHIYLTTGCEGKGRRSPPTTPFREAQYALAIQSRGDAAVKLCRLQPSEGKITHGLVGHELAGCQSKNGC